MAVAVSPPFQDKVATVGHSRSDHMSMSHLRRRGKVEVCEQLLRRLRDTDSPLLQEPSFVDNLRQHFLKLPTRYALDVNIEGDDVLTHMKLLDEARAKKPGIAYHIRLVNVFGPAASTNEMGVSASPTGRGSLTDAAASPTGLGLSPGMKRMLSASASRPAFGSSPNLESLALEGAKGDGEGSASGIAHHPMHEVTISTVDQPKLLSRLSSLLADVDLNIREAHAFSSSDGYSLDVFVVDGWEDEDVESLKEAFEQAVAKFHAEPPAKGSHPGGTSQEEARASGREEPRTSEASPAGGVEEQLSGLTLRQSSLLPGGEDWELDPPKLHFGPKIASGAFGDLYRGTYCSQDVAIKILKDVNEDSQQLREFLQEVSIMRKIRHKNVVQFIGACTTPPNLCIVFEFMPGGSVYDYLHRNNTQLRTSQLLKVALDVASAMDYLHQRNVIHRDLKAANLLMDEHETVKVADFGVARVQTSTGVMTAETGTYRWMAPEVIEHRPYDSKADVFSFGIVLWELLTGRVPYSNMTPLQAAVGVVQKGLRPEIPPKVHPDLVAIMQACWLADPGQRPSFNEICKMLQQAQAHLKQEEDSSKKKGFMQRLREGRMSRTES